MKMQNDGRKKLLWIIPVCVLALLLAVGGLVWALIGGPAQKPEASGVPQEELKLYWNVEGPKYQAQEMIRYMDGEGMIYMQMACDGEQMRIPCASMTLANKIDMHKIVGLVMDENGVIIEAYGIEDLGYSYAAREHVVVSVDGNQITSNSSPSQLGFEVTFEISENTQVYNVGGEGVLVGMPAQVAVEDEIYAVKNAQGEVTHVFTAPYEPPMDVYWNVNRQWNATAAMTTRLPDATGMYAVEVACNGQLSTLYIRDMDIVNDIDKQAAKCFGLRFDENGEIAEVIHAGTATGGGSCASWYHCMSIEDTQAEFKRLISGSSYGSTARYSIAKNCKVFDVSGLGAYVGEPTTVCVTDTVHCLRDSRGQICVIFVVNRVADSEIYWNVERKWDATNQVSTRTPAADGYYYIKLAVGGVQKTYRTKDKAIVDLMDGRAAKCFGIEAQGDEIVKFYTPDQVSGGGTFASWADVVELDGDYIVTKKISTNATTGEKTETLTEGTIAEDCEIYNVSSNATLVGEKTTVQLGDRIHALKNINGEVCVIFVVNRYENLPIYYNLDRKFSTKTKETTRKPDGEGYYVFRMAHEGKEVTVKTTSKAIATAIDKEAGRCLGLSVKDGIVYKAIHAQNTAACKGGPTSSYCVVTSVSKYGFNTLKTENGKTYSETYAGNCKIYNVSDSYSINPGEPTTVQKGDMVHCLKNEDGNVCYVYIVTRFEDYEVYYNRTRKWDSTTLTTTRVPDANGVYEFKMGYNGNEVTLYTKDINVANAIDSQTAKCVGLAFDQEGYIVKAVHAKSTNQCSGGIGPSYADVTELSADGLSGVIVKTENGSSTTYNVKIAQDAKVYNVSTNVESHWFEPTTVKVGDNVHCLKNAAGELCYIVVLDRKLSLDLPVYYNRDRKWNSKTEITTRTPNANGEYEFKMGYNGAEVVLKTKDINVVNSIDREAAKCVGLEIGQDGYITKAVHAKNTLQCSGGIGPSYADVTELSADGLSGVIVKTENGKATTYNVKIAQDAKVYNVSTNVESHWFEPTTVKVGDNVHCLKNAAGELCYIVVLSRPVVLPTTAHTCQHVTENVTWYSWNGTDSIDQDGYYVLTGDAQMTNRIELKDGVKATICLNGHTITSSDRVFSLRECELTICDHQDGQGNWLGGIVSNYTVEDDTKIYGGIAYMYNSSYDSTLNIYGGNYSYTGKITSGGLFYVGNSSDAKAGIASLNLYDGAFNGTGTATGINLSNNSHVAVYGGTVQGDIYVDGTGLFLGGQIDNIRLRNHSNTTAAVGGNVQIGQISLNTDQTLGIHGNGLEDTASVTVSVTDTEKAFTTITDPNDEACFKPADPDTYKIENRAGGLYMVSKYPPHVHCLCNGTITGEAYHTCGDVTFQPWTETTSLPTDGNFYLTEDVTVSAITEITDNKTLNLCLNGHTITNDRDDAKRFFTVRGDLNIADCGTTGKILSYVNSTSANGGIAYIYSGNGGNMSIYGGTLELDGQARGGGIIYVGNNTNGTSVLNIYGGTLKNGNVTGNGGGVFISNKCTVNMYGGTVTGSYAGASGGAFYVTGGCTLNIYGGTVTGSTGGIGRSVRAAADSVVNLLGGKLETVGSTNISCGDATVVLTLGGDIQITGADKNLRLAEGQIVAIHADGLEETASVGIFMDVPGTFAAVTTDYAARFVSDDTDYNVLFENGELKLVGSAAPVVHTHCLCSDTITGEAYHTCGDVTFEPWTNETALPTDGNYYLAVDVTISTTTTVTDNKTLNLCLNGHTITNVDKNAARFFTVRGDLNITDCGTTGKILSIMENTDANGSIAYIYSGNGGNMSIYAGTLELQGKVKAAGLIYVGNNTTDTSVLNIYGGTLTGGTATNNGGAVYISNACTVNMYGGTIQNCTAANGGAFNVDSGCTLNLHGGTITNCGTNPIYEKAGSTVNDNRPAVASVLGLPQTKEELLESLKQS